MLSLVVLVCGGPILIALGMALWVAFDVLVLDLLRGGRDIYLALCEAKLERNRQAQNLLLPYVSWSDTVAHTHTHG